MTGWIHVAFNPDYRHPYDMNAELVLEDQFCGKIDWYPNERTKMVFQSISMYKGNDRTFRIYVKDRDLNPINVSNSVGIFTLKPNKSATAANFTLSTSNPAEGTIGSPDQGEMFFYIKPANTNTLEPTQYSWDVKVTLPTGKVYNVIEGTFNLLNPVSV